jgi:hypothetical protein
MFMTRRRRGRPLPPGERLRTYACDAFLYLPVVFIGTEMDERGNKRGLTEEEQAKIIQLMQEGKTPDQIAKAVGRDKRTVDHFLATEVLPLLRGGLPAPSGGELVIRPIGNAELTKGIIAVPQQALQAGQMAGLALSPWALQIGRLLGGRANRGEAESFVAGLAGLFLGGYAGAKSYYEVLPEERPEERRRAREEELKRVINEATTDQAKVIAKAVVLALKELKDEGGL